MSIDSIATLLEPVKTAGAMALKKQKQMGAGDIGFKEDNSVITTVDPLVEGYLVEKMTALFPDANILAEEKTRRFDPDKPNTFALDPIDGTDSFSQGMAGWCVSLALLDHGLHPVAGIIFAPMLDLFMFADVDKRAVFNGNAVAAPGSDEPLSGKSNIMVTSSIHHQLDISGLPGKIRSIGSAALHLAGPVIYPGVFAAVDGGRGRIWDVAAAHAIVLSVGYCFEYFSGKAVEYASLTDGRPVEDLILAGPEPRIVALRECLSRY